MKSHLLRRIYGFLMILSFALWWGGLTTYAVIVVQIGTELFGASEQGFVTQRVTNWLNVLGAVWLACTLWPARRSWGTMTLWGVQAVCLGSLALIHRQLDAMLDPVSRFVVSDGDFYGIHRLYLLATAVQWFVGLGLLWSLPPLAVGSDRETERV